MRKFFVILLGMFLSLTNINYKYGDENQQFENSVTNSNFANKQLLLNNNEDFKDNIVSVNFEETNEIKHDYLGLDYYKFNFNGTFYVGNVSKAEKSTLVECKLIVNCSLYNNFGEFDFLKNEKYVLELIEYNADTDTLNKSFYVVKEEPATSIINKSLEIDENSNLYFSLLSTLNIEFTYKSTHQPMLFSNNIEPVKVKEAKVNDQGALDYYLDVTSSKSDATMIATHYRDGYVYTHDDSIVNLFAKYMFTSNNTYAGGGSEWGYFAKTYNDIGNNKICSLLIYDIENYESDSVSADLTEIKVVLHKNYKYLYDSDVVVGDVDNNYCLGNPQYKSSIRYFKPVNVKDAKAYPNPDDKSDYNPLNDYGFSFGTVATKMRGRYKNSTGFDDGLTRFFKFLVSVFSDLIVTGALSAANIPLGASFAISQIAGLITDVILDASFKQQQNSSPFIDLQHWQFMFESISFNDYSNFDDMRANKDLLKEIGIIVPNNSGSYLSTERERPLLFKNSNDYISYRTNILSSERNADYYALISHFFKVEVFNDTSNLISWYPEYLGCSESEWFYTLGRDTKPDDVTAKADGSVYAVNFGKTNYQNVYFIPNSVGIYDFHFDKIDSYTKIEIYDQNNSLIKSGTPKTTTVYDKWNNSRTIVSNNNYYLSCQLVKGYTYKIVIYRKNTNNVYLFGTALLDIFKFSNSISPISNSLSFKRRVNDIPGNEASTLHFLSNSIDLYTFVASSNKSTYIDTCVEIRDSNYRLLFKSEAGAYSDRGMISATLKQKERFNIIVINKTKTQNSCKLYTYKESYLPYIRGQNVNVGFDVYFKGVKHFYYLIRYGRSFSGNIVIEFLTNNINRTPINVELIDYKEQIIRTHKISDSNQKPITISSNTFYYLHLYTTSSLANENCILNIG